MSFSQEQIDAILKANILAPKQLEFILNSNSKFNIADGSVRSGKTVCVLFRFMMAVANCPGDQIWMIGHSLDTVFHNCVRLLLDDNKLNPLRVFTPYVTWSPSGHFTFLGKKVFCLGARDERAVGPIQGKTFDLCYCNEMTLYPENVIEMITTRLSMPHSQLFADMNPVQPSHPCKKWIDFGTSGDKKYYSLHFSIDDNIFLTEEFKNILKQTLTGLFFRRNYLGEWCLAEGAIFDFFDRNVHVAKQQRAVDYWVAGIDYGASNAFACIILGIREQHYGNDHAYAQVQAEYYYDPKNKRTKTNGELVRDLKQVFERFPVKAVYLDPSAASFRAELRANGIPTMDTDNEVLPGITLMTSLLNEGEYTIYHNCVNLIREIEGYCWDPSASKKGEDKPLKVADHAVDALRYALMGVLKGRSTLKQTGKPRSDPDFGRGLGQQGRQNPFGDQNRGWGGMR